MGCTHDSSQAASERGFEPEIARLVRRWRPQLARHRVGVGTLRGALEHLFSALCAHRAVWNQGVSRLSGVCSQGIEQTRNQQLGHVEAALASPACQLDRASLRYFHRLFGRDFSTVSIHADGIAAQSAAALGVLAYTIGRHIVFSQPSFEPGTAAGRVLIAHELTHVLQQTGYIQAPVGTERPLELKRERQAEEVARCVADYGHRADTMVSRLRIIPAPVALQAINPVIAKCGAICPEVIIDPLNGVPCGLADCEFLGFFPPIIARSWCAYSCAVNKFGAFIINTNFGRLWPYFLRGNAAN